MDTTRVVICLLLVFCSFGCDSGDSKALTPGLDGSGRHGPADQVAWFAGLDAELRTYEAWRPANTGNPMADSNDKWKHDNHFVSQACSGWLCQVVEIGSPQQVMIEEKDIWSLLGDPPTQVARYNLPLTLAYQGRRVAVEYRLIDLPKFPTFSELRPGDGKFWFYPGQNSVSYDGHPSSLRKTN